MNRNNTLNEVVFAAALHAHLTPQALDQFRQTALALGLAEDEVQSTIQSALDGAARSWKYPLQWLRQVQTMASARRVKPRLADAAFVIAHIVATTKWAKDDLTLSLSCRELAERLGVHHSTASQLLRDLRDLGLLVGVLPPGQSRTPSEHARSYRLILRTDVIGKFPDTLPAPPGGDGCVSDLFSLAAMRHGLAVRSHRLFQASGGGIRFTNVDAVVLLWLNEVGEGTLLDAIKASGAVRKTVKSSIDRLLSAGFLDWRDDVLRRDSCDDQGLLEELDHMADYFEIPDKDLVRVQLHRQQRQYRKANLIARQKAFQALDVQIGDKWRRQAPPGTAGVHK